MDLELSPKLVHRVHAFSLKFGQHQILRVYVVILTDLFNQLVQAHALFLLGWNVGVYHQGLPVLGKLVLDFDKVLLNWFWLRLGCWLLLRLLLFWGFYHACDIALVLHDLLLEQEQGLLRVLGCRQFHREGRGLLHIVGKVSIFVRQEI